MAARRTEPPTIHPTLPREKAHAALKKQLESLNLLEGKNYQEAKADEQEWNHLTQSIVERAFGNPSSNLTKYYGARSAGSHQIVPYGGGINFGRLQNNFDQRILAMGALLRSLLAELQLDLPDAEVKGVYEQGEEYEFYRDLKGILEAGTSDVFIIDPYANVEVFDVYASGISRHAKFRLLATKVPDDLLAVARKYAGGGNLGLRSSDRIHDRVIFVDDRVWLAGQSLKDAAKKKPTYIVEHDATLMRAVYEPLWTSAAIVV